MTGFNSSEDVPASKKACGVAMNLGNDAQIRVAYLTNRGETAILFQEFSVRDTWERANYSVKKNKDTLGHLIRFFKVVGSVNAAEFPYSLSMMKQTMPQ